MSSAISDLRERLGELSDLDHAGRLLSWDQQTQMPPRGAEARAQALATLGRIAHEIFIADDTGRRIDAAAKALIGVDPDSDEARLVDFARRDWERARRVPSSLAAELARAASIGQEAWVGARATSNFAAFAPHLRHMLDLKKRYVECLMGAGGYACAYDVLLDDHDRGLTTADVSRLFSELRTARVPMIAALSARAQAVSDAPLRGTFPVERQRALIARIVGAMGFNAESWRIDDAVHPFAASFGRADVRITNRWDESFFASALYGAMHETGHGLYEAQIDASLQRTPLGTGSSLGLHESQSRLWENMVGRGADFAAFLAPLLAETFGTVVDARSLYRAVNRVAPSLIRVEADEATYGLHVILRFEIEQELIEGRLDVDDLPEAWNARFRELLALEVPDDARGVLQDVHWSVGAIGYFPTYSIGNLVAGHLWEHVEADITDVADQIRAGELDSLREWLRETVHRHGSKFTTAEVVRRVTGEQLSVRPFVRYLEAKLADVYELSA